MARGAKGVESSNEQMQPIRGAKGRQRTNFDDEMARSAPYVAAPGEIERIFPRKKKRRKAFSW